MGNKFSRARHAYKPPRTRPKERQQHAYAAFDAIDGRHPWRHAVPGGYVNYHARTRASGKVMYFNFALAKEIGLVPSDHAHRMNAKLEKKILSTFGLQILNEYDEAMGTTFPRHQLKPNAYMATRYLQLQHKDKSGRTSGDGRSIWNGCCEHNGALWDFSSCGTGVTRLSPGAVSADRPLRTGSGSYSYGSGRAGLDEGLSTAIASEILHRLGTETERVLAIIEFPGSTAVNVRAAKNLVRPSHLFCHLKQENLDLLTSGFDYFIERQISNARWPVSRTSPKKYDDALRILAKRYAEFAAQLEDQYVFCWMDWDGDNMLASGGIIDYGSIRQFGLCHDRYRYDDDDRWSTNLTEQRAKARYIVQTFAQLVDYVNTGRKKAIEDYGNSSALQVFDETFTRKREALLLGRLGFNRAWIDRILSSHRKEFLAFEAYYRWFEAQKTNTGFRKTGDGINWYAVYAIREVLVALPKHLLANGRTLEAKIFLDTIRTDYASQAFLKLDSFKERKIAGFQDAYLALVRAATGGSEARRSVLAELVMRSSQANWLDPVTGDGVLYLVDRVIRTRRRFTKAEIQTVIEALIDEKTRAFYPTPVRRRKLSKRAEKLLVTLLELAYQHRFSI